MSKEVNFVADKVRLIAYHQSMRAEGVADLQVIVTAASVLPAANDLEIIDSAFWSLQTLAGSANRGQLAYPVTNLAALAEFINGNFVPNQKSKIIRL